MPDQSNSNASSSSAAPAPSPSASSPFAPSGQVTIPPMLVFTGDKARWPTFKNRFCAYLMTLKLLEVIQHEGPAAARQAAANGAGAGGASSSSTPAPPTAAEVESWQDRCGRVYTLLVMCVQCDSLAVKINNVRFGDAFAVWNVLLARFERRSTNNLMQVTAQLHSAKMNTSDAAPLDMFVARIRSLELALTELGEAPTDAVLKIVLLQGLPPSYESVVVVLRMKEKITFDAMVAHLEDHEENLRTQEKVKAETDEIASFAREKRSHQQQQQRSSGRGAGVGSSSHQFRGGAGSGPQRLCYGCNQPGHVAFDCPKNRNAIKCSLCRQLGHTDKQCQSTRRGRGAGASNRRGKQQPPREEDDDEDGHVHFAADPERDDEEGYGFVIIEALTAAAGLKPSSIIVDSGASIHLSNNKKKMHNLRRLDTPINLRVADNKVMQLHEVGDMVVKLPGHREITLNHVAYHPELATNLLSVARATEAGFVVHFGSDSAIIHKLQPDGSLGPKVCEANRQGRLYVLRQRGDPAPTSSATASNNQEGGAPGGKPIPAETAMQGNQAPAAPASQAAPAPTPGGAAASSSSSSSKSAAESLSSSVEDLWHMRLGHAAMRRIQQLSHSDALAGLPKLTEEAWQSKATSLETVCGSCAKGKQHRHAFKKHKPESALATVAGAAMCGDLTGPVMLKKSVNEQQELVASLGGNSYASTLIDEATGKIFVDALPKKSDAAGALMIRLNRIQKSGRHVVKFHTDGGGEYAVKKLQEYFHQHGIEHTTTQAHTPQHNGIAERVNRTMFEMARCMLQHAKLGPEFWVLAVTTAAYLINRTRTVEWSHSGSSVALRLMTSEEAWTGVRPNVKHVRVFGSDCYVHVPDPGRGKLDARAQPAVFVGYPESKPGYLVFLLSTGKVIVSRDVMFNENQFTFRGEALNAALCRPGSYDDERSIGQILDNIQFEQDLKEALRNSREEKQAADNKKEQHQSAVGPGVMGESKANSSAAASSGNPGLSLLSAAASASSAPVASVSVSASAPAPVAAAAAAAAAPAAGVPPRRPAAPASASSSKRSTSVPPAAAAGPVTGGRNSARLAAKGPVDYVYATYEAAADAFELELEEAEQQQEQQAFEARESAPSDPTSYTDAMSRPERVEWLDGMKEEIEAHRRNGTWRLVPLPQGRRAIGCKWVFKTKEAVAGEKKRRHKARLVAKGFSQRAGVDYHETFAPTLKYVTFRLLLILAAAFNLELKQMDVTTAYLNAFMDEEVYMQQPEGFEERDANGLVVLVCLLIKSLYGTKQAGAMWNKAVNAFLVEVLGYSRCVSDPCLYHRVSSTGRVMLLGLFVDDILSAYSTEDEAEWLHLKSLFMTKYASKDLGDAELVLGMRIRRDRGARTLMLDQQSYVEKVLQQFRMEGCNSSHTPEQSNMRLSVTDSIVEEQRDQPANQQRKERYQELVGCLLYAALSTRADIAHAVNQLSRFLAAPGEVHWQAAKRVLRYLAATPKLCLTFAPEDLEAKYFFGPGMVSKKTPLVLDGAAGFEVPVSAFSDSDWGGCEDTRRSTTGFVVLLFGCCPLSWSSKKQSTVALSSAEAEYMAIGMVLKELKWTRGLLREIGAAGVEPERKEKQNQTRAEQQQPEASAATAAASSSERPSSSTFLPASPIFVDNQAAMSMCMHRGSLHSRTKHIDVRHHFIQEAVRLGQVRLEWVATQDQLADIFTKPLGRQVFGPMRDRLMGPQAAAGAAAATSSSNKQ